MLYTRIMSHRDGFMSHVRSWLEHLHFIFSFFLNVYKRWIESSLRIGRPPRDWNVKYDAWRLTWTLVHKSDDVLLEVVSFVRSFNFPGKFLLLQRKNEGRNDWKWADRSKQIANRISFLLFFSLNIISSAARQGTRCEVGVCWHDATEQSQSKLWCNSLFDVYMM